MILIPERKLVVILVPRTGSGSLYRAVMDAYPKAMMPYRHMEADGVPLGYDRWLKVGVARNPVDRLYSLYKFVRTMGTPHESNFIEAVRKSAQLPFNRWVVENETVFTCPYDRGNQGRFWPEFSVRHALPENRKSQFMYLRPDLGTHILNYDKGQSLADFLEVKANRVNATEPGDPPKLSGTAWEYIRCAFSWDLQVTA